MLDVRDLIRIEAVAAHGGFTRAAAALGMTQPALTRSIASSEGVVRGQLFRRGRNGAEPTALCRMILADAPEIIQRMQDLHGRLGRVRGGSGEEVAVVTGPFPSETTCLPAAAAFRRSHPRVRVRIETFPWPAALARLRARLCDLAVVTAGANFGEGDVAVEPLPAQRLVFVVAGGHPLTRGARVSSARILSYPLVTTAHLSPRLHAALAEARGRATETRRADIPCPAVLVESASAWLALLEGTDNVALTTLPAAARALGTGGIAVLPFEAPWLAARHAIVHLAKRQPSAAASSFAAELKKANTDAIAQAAALWSGGEPSRP